MVDNRLFKNSLLISISAHLLVFLLVSPEFHTRYFPCDSFPQVNFISTSLGEIFSKKSVSDSDELNPAYDFFKRKMCVLNVIPQRIGCKQEKTEPHRDYAQVNPEFDKVSFSLAEYENLEIKGPLRKRVIMFRPEPPQIPAWSVEEISGSLEVELWVDDKGDVFFCRKITSSGSSALDIIGIDYVRKFKFMPHQKLLQWGKIEIPFDNPAEAHKN